MRNRTYNRMHKRISRNVTERLRVPVRNNLLDKPPALPENDAWGMITDGMQSLRLGVAGVGTATERLHIGVLHCYLLRTGQRVLDRLIDTLSKPVTFALMEQHSLPIGVYEDSIGSRLDPAVRCIRSLARIAV